MKKLLAIILAALTFVNVIFVQTAASAVHAGREIDNQMQALAEQVRGAVSARTSDEERRAVIERVTVAMSKLSPQERLALTDQILMVLAEAEKQNLSDVDSVTTLATVMVFAGILVLIAASDTKSPRAAGAGLAVLMGAALLKLAVARPENLKARVTSLRSELEILRDSQRQSLDAAELQ